MELQTKKDHCLRWFKILLITGLPMTSFMDLRKNINIVLRILKNLIIIGIYFQHVLIIFVHNRWWNLQCCFQNVVREVFSRLWSSYTSFLDAEVEQRHNRSIGSIHQALQQPINIELYGQKAKKIKVFKLHSNTFFWKKIVYCLKFYFNLYLFTINKLLKINLFLLLYSMY